MARYKVHVTQLIEVVGWEENYDDLKRGGK